MIGNITCGANIGHIHSNGEKHPLDVILDRYSLVKVYLKELISLLVRGTRSFTHPLFWFVFVHRDKAFADEPRHAWHWGIHSVHLEKCQWLEYLPVKAGLRELVFSWKYWHNAHSNWKRQCFLSFVFIDDIHAIVQKTTLQLVLGWDIVLLIYKLCLLRKRKKPHSILPVILSLFFNYHHQREKALMPRRTVHMFSTTKKFINV